MPAPLRIAQLNSLLTGGGTDDQCVKLAQGLRRLGQEVWIVGPDGREMSKRIRQAEVPLWAIAREGPLKSNFILQAARFVRRNQIQIVHAHHGRDYWPAVLTAKLGGARLVLTRHLAKSPSSWFSRRFLLDRCDAMIAVSEFVARVLREGAYEPGSPNPERRARPPLRGDPSKIHVIHGGIDMERFRPLPPGDPAVAALRHQWGLDPEHFAFGVVGGFDLPRGKGQREFLRAAAQMHRQAPQCRFLIVGSGNMKHLLERDVHDLGLGGRASLTGQCADMVAGMNALDCLVHPQVGTEAWSLVVLEAFACGRPVIASALDGVSEAYAAGGCGQLVPPESIEDLARAMSARVGQLRLEDPARERLHAQVAGAFSVEALASKVHQLYCRLLQEAPS